MSNRLPRFLPEGGALVEVTYRTIQGRMLLRPSRKLNEIVVGTLARARSLCSENARNPVELVGIVVLSNHIHLLLWVKTQYQLSKLLEHFAGNTAREVNRHHDWSGSLWSRRYQGICVTTEEAAQVARLEYLLAQGVKEGLVERVKDWPGIHFGKTLLEGRSLLAGKWIDRTRKYRAKVQGKELRRKEYEETLTVELKPLPCWAHLGWGKYLERIRELVQRVEKEAAADRERRGVEVVGVQAICEKDPQTRPNEVSTSPAPRVHAATKRERKAWREAFQWFVVAYRAAAELLKEGHLDAPFPEGCFPPGLPFVGDTG